MLVEQVPSKLVDEAFSNINVKIVHRLPAQGDRDKLAEPMRFTTDQKRDAGSLTPFTAFAFHDGIDRAVMVTVPDMRGAAAQEAGATRAPVPADGPIRQRILTLAAERPQIDAAVAPFTACAGCEHRCEFRTRAAVAVQGVAADELPARWSAGEQDDQWWRRLIGWVGTIADQVAGNAMTDAARRDYAACVFVQLTRRAWPGQAPQSARAWPAIFRQKVRDLVSS